jgi:deoxycytidine triphosphate deaminase
MAFTQANYDTLLTLSKNKWLRNTSAENKYEKFKTDDPFPTIPTCQLNSADILRYVTTIGMIEPFNPELCEGVTYQCHFSGTYYRWLDDKEVFRDTKTLSDTELLELRPNSITYLEIKEHFQVPDYLLFRYNLNVSHVYKGLLLGTGPIVDPGFVGHLFIPEYGG